MQNDCMQSFMILLKIKDRKDNTEDKGYCQKSLADLETVMKPRF